MPYLFFQNHYQKSIVEKNASELVFSTMGSNHQYYAEFPYKTSIRLWIDVPNIVPFWRKCLHQWNSKAITYECGLSSLSGNGMNQALELVPIKGSLHNFQLQLAMKNMCLEKENGSELAVFVKTCTDGTYWRWTKDALLEWKKITAQQRAKKQKLKN